MGAQIQTVDTDTRVTVELGNRVNYLNEVGGTIRQAATDIFVAAIITGAGGATIYGWHDTATPPTKNCQGNEATTKCSVFFTVKKDEYWKITCNVNVDIYTIPLTVTIVTIKP